jgi:DNA recombination protein RmuC
METQLFQILFSAAIGVGVGAFVSWALSKGRLAAATQQGRTEQSADLAVLAERARASEAALDKLSTAHEVLKTQSEALRDSLDKARDDLATQTERASRISVVEATLAEAQRVSADAQKQGAELRESSSRLVAELNAERESLVQARQELQLEKSQRVQASAMVGDVQKQVADLREAAGRLTAELNAERESLALSRSEMQAEKSKKLQAETMVGELTATIAELKTLLEAEQRKAAADKALLLEAKEVMSNQFKSLANDILEEKSKRFTEQNQTNIGQLLNPLRDRMIEFKSKVEEIHNKDTEQQATLKAELAQMKELNRQMTEEAHGLAVALKGQAKKQGNWGELVLGNVLDRSGLREGKDFKREVSFNTEDGRKRPDVVIYLPQSKHLVIDAKVSLNAYTRYVNAEDDLVRQQALQEHVKAISSRIQELANRAYFELPGLNTPEMVFMFIPIESAFVEALRADEALFQKAIEQNVLVATPTTLLTSLNIVKQLWRFEEQNAHTAELADRASKVYKKLVGFLGNMDALGKQLDRAKESFGSAMGQLYTGKGNLISQAKEFEVLGVSVQTPLPEHLVAKAALELEHLPETAEGAEMETTQA